jgi:hypothetical protein
MGGQAVTKWETDELLGYDADHDDSSQYCAHGTWIGSWWGPDYLCQWCEDGISVEEMHRIQAHQAAAQRDARARAFTEVCRVVGDVKPYNAALATYLTIYVMEQFPDG